MTPKLIVLVIGMALCMTLGACSGGTDEPKGPNYTPIPDKQLFAQIADIPGVSEVDVEYRDTFTEGKGYVGDIVIDPKADATKILDHSIAILRQGRWQVGISVSGLQDQRVISTDVVGLKSPTEPYLSERYGPQPGDGEPPAK